MAQFMKSNTTRTRQILLCVAGMTPQIITETLWALIAQRGGRVDEIRVITTLDGRDKILTGIANGRGKPEESLLHPQHGQFYAFCRDFGIDPSEIKFSESNIALIRTSDGRTLPDIRTAEDNDCAADYICEIVRELTRDPQTRLHASAAGGRKTMSVYLTAAMQLFGRAHDCLSHVLVSEDFETEPAFFYKPPQPREIKLKSGRIASTDEAEIYLADIPFIRLRGVGAEWRRLEPTRRYRDIVRQAQDDLDIIEKEYGVIINIARRQLQVRGRTIRLTPRELFFYVMFADFRKADKYEGKVALDELTRADFERTFRRITAAMNDEVGLEECEGISGYEFLKEMVEEATNASKFENFKEKFYVTATRIRKRIAAANLEEEYAIQLCDGRGSARYRLPLAPDRINFI
jgi:CRISPR-associated protein (TIGR02584 family)